MVSKTASIKPTITDMISLEFVSHAKISPSGDKIAYCIRNTNWKRDAYESECFIFDIEKNKTFQLTRYGKVNEIAWMNNESLAVLKVDPEMKENANQIFVFEDLIGEPIKITDHKNDIQNFKIFGEGIVFLSKAVEGVKKNERKNKFGSFIHFEQERSTSALYYVDYNKMKNYLAEKKKKNGNNSKIPIKPVIEITKLLKEPLSILSYIVSPQDDAIYLNCQSRDDRVYEQDSSNYQIRINPNEALNTYLQKQSSDKKETKNNNNKDVKDDDVSYLGALTKIAFPIVTSIVNISPDGKKLLIARRERDNFYFTQSDLWILDVDEWQSLLAKEEIIDKLVKITSSLDRTAMSTHWVKEGIFCSHVDGTKTAISHISESGKITTLDLGGNSTSLFNTFDISESGRLCLLIYNSSKMEELYISQNPLTLSELELIQITNIGKQVQNWQFGTVETIRWPSKDGAEIEGVLRKPEGFNPKKKYPLVFIIHGGPASFDAENILPRNDLYYYPGIQFSNLDMLVLKVNYRGSIGRGQAFLELNKDNLGIGDMWDIESAIDYLDQQGFVDTTKIGCMGWSQGGYISAFVGIHSKRFKAVSVGAGIADWYTYHISNDIPQFTTHYLSGSPFRNRELYEKTAPISNIKNAKTPTLIQHGEIDQRVPLSNAKELYRGLKEMNVPVELFIYPGMGHPIHKPKANRSVMYQNLNWFSHYLLGEDLNLFDEKKMEK